MVTHFFSSSISECECQPYSAKEAVHKGLHKVQGNGIKLLLVQKALKASPVQ